MKEATTVEKSEFIAKNEKTGKPETGCSPSNPDSEKLEELKETVTEEEN